MLTALFTAAILIVFATRLSELDGQTSAAVLLLVPAVVSAYLSRAGEHPFATRMLTGVRFLALAGGTLAVILSAMIGAGFMKLETAPTPKSQQANPPPAATVTGFRCSTTAMPRPTVPTPLSCSALLQRPRSHRVNPTVTFISWALAVLGLLVAATLALGYAAGTYVRKVAAS
jgi:hypothetical protein